MRPVVPTRFTVRVYGILTNERGDILLSDENINGFQFTKFPGGGLEFGEGPEECVSREFNEETDLRIRIKELLYVTGFYIQSKFRPEEQVIAIYYLVEPEEDISEKEVVKAAQTRIVKEPDNILTHRWIPLDQLTEDHLTFESDKAAVKVFLNTHLKNYSNGF